MILLKNPIFYIIESFCSIRMYLAMTENYYSYDIVRNLTASLNFLRAATHFYQPLFLDSLFLIFERIHFHLFYSIYVLFNTDPRCCKSHNYRPIRSLGALLKILGITKIKIIMYLFQFLIWIEPHKNSHYQPILFLLMIKII